MNEYGFGQLSFSERVAIETGICKGETFRQIAKRIGRHPSTVSHERFDCNMQENNIIVNSFNENLK